MTSISKVERLKASVLGPLTDILKDESVPELVVSGHEDILVRRERHTSYEARPFDATRLKSLARKLAQSIRQPLSSERRSCLLYTSPSPRDATLSRMPSSA